MFELVIVADTNDGDFVTGINKITQEQLDQLLPIVDVIKKKHGQWPTLDIGDPRDVYTEYELTDEQIEFFNDFVEHGEYGVHDIEKIEYYPVPNKRVLFSRW